VLGEGKTETKQRCSITFCFKNRLCLCGVIALVLTDILGNSFRQGNSVNPLIGDFLCLAAAVLYAVSNVGQEAAVTQNSKLEYLAMLGLFATPLSLAQSAAIEHSRWVTTEWTPLVIGLMIGFGVCLWCVYALVPIMLERSGATFLNLSLLTSDVFAIAAGIFLFNFVPSVFYILAALLIVAGLIVYNFSSRNEGDSPEIDPV
jgi:solute carrier family 35 protein F1/2